jgi:hypothetical protein
MLEDLFDVQELQPQRAMTHACTGPGCHFCEWLDGHQAKAKGTQAVNYDPRWLHEATEWRRGQIGREITADDLIEAIGLPDGHPNQIGALFRKWAGMGLARQTGLVQSRRNSNHARRVIIWEVTA